MIWLHDFSKYLVYIMLKFCQHTVYGIPYTTYSTWAKYFSVFRSILQRLRNIRYQKNAVFNKKWITNKHILRKCCFGPVTVLLVEKFRTLAVFLYQVFFSV